MDENTAPPLQEVNTKNIAEEQVYKLVGVQPQRGGDFPPKALKYTFLLSYYFRPYYPPTFLCISPSYWKGAYKQQEDKPEREVHFKCKIEEAPHEMRERSISSVKLSGVKIYT